MARSNCRNAFTHFRRIPFSIWIWPHTSLLVSDLPISFWPRGPPRLCFPIDIASEIRKLSSMKRQRNIAASVTDTTPARVRFAFPERHCLQLAPRHPLWI